MSSNIASRPRRWWLTWLLILFLLVISYGAGFGSACWYYENRPNWQANVREGAPFHQSGRFRTLSGQAGAVQFPLPYRFAPNVELDMTQVNKTLVTETTSEGFRWKNIGDDNVVNNTDVTWHAKGVRRLQPDGK